jgi:hypothetical protein
MYARMVIYAMLGWMVLYVDLHSATRVGALIDINISPLGRYPMK